VDFELSIRLLFSGHSLIARGEIERARCARKNSGLEFVMAQVCEICGKGPQFGNNISHAHNVTRRRWNVNLRPVKVLVGGGAKKLRVCTSCIKAGKVVKA
jgi:large subunit ribosomal protein L28